MVEVFQQAAAKYRALMQEKIKGKQRETET